MKTIIIFLSFVAWTLPVHSKTIQVCGSCRIQSIHQAIESSIDGDTILVKEGNYKEHDIIINKSITIKGTKGAVIDGENVGTIFTIKADDVSISNLKLINVGHSYTQDFTGILIQKSRNFVIQNNRLENVFFGIKIEKSQYGRIEGNHVSSDAKEDADSGNGIHAWYSSNLEIKNNILHNMRDGIYFEFVKESFVQNNRSYHNIRYGLHFMFSNNNSYINNEFYENGAGVAVMFSKYIIMKNNIFKNNWGTASYGLLLKEIYDVQIHGNQFINNTIAINTEGATRINYTNNVFKSNGWAVKVTGACYGNIYERNNFLGNALDVSYNSRINDNKFIGNYWGSYTGYDLNKDGIGDVPHRPVKLFSFIVNRTPEAIILLRSMFVDLINFSEKVSPIFTPDDIVDPSPSMREF